MKKKLLVEIENISQNLAVVRPINSWRRFRQMLYDTEETNYKPDIRRHPSHAVEDTKPVDEI
ncbi:CLUMA_CG005901, isoform A [Clunio marinus]|uniref:CLUMA_CG005901, isoform A n=1 Tax=Clunio marinus TaxID=568069 RepID=A0A1J1HW43_9DIPT|nr:CLUMA_CG005901, isoform A [Clunio marinus]